jgi:hypothetical protein
VEVGGREEESVKTVVDRSLDLKHAGHHYKDFALKDKANQKNSPNFSDDL